METNKEDSSPKYCTVVLLENAFCMDLGTPKKVLRGEDAVFDFKIKKGYTFESVNYRDYEISISEPDTNGIRIVNLTLKSVRYTEALEITTKKAVPTYSSEIIYHLNGGERLDGVEEDVFSISYKLERHYRPNTEKGTDIIKRENYVQIGWNTEADGSGIHVGLGSKAPVYDGGRLHLYAEWARYTANSFEYALIDEEELEKYYAKEKTFEELTESKDDENCSIVIRRYEGDVERLVVPETIEGYSVVAIGSRAVQNCENLSSVVLPKSMKVLEDFAFDQCPNLQEVYLYDSLQRLGNNAFGDPFTLTTLHINAIRNPIYGRMEATQVANKNEMLRNHDGIKPKIVVFGSCSAFYGVSAANIQKAFPEYDVFNMGVAGGICALYQLELIKTTLKEGDIFIQVAELASEYQLFASYDFAQNVFASLENNYDYLAELNMQDYGEVISSLSGYLFGKKSLSQSMSGSYDWYLDTMSEQGDLLKERAGGFDNKGIAYPTLSAEWMSSSNIFTEMTKIYGDLYQKGVKTYLGFSPMNQDGLDLEEMEKIETLFHQQFSMQTVPVEFINDMDDAIMRNEYFSDTNYHLTLEGATVFTNALIEGLRPHLYQ